MGLVSSIKGLFTKDSNGYGYLTKSFGVLEPSYYDNAKVSEAYDEIPEVSIVINKRAQMCSLVKIKLFDKNDNEIEKHPALDVLLNPNPLQTQEELIYQYVVFLSVFGNSYQYNNRALDNQVPSFFWNINPLYVTPKVTGKLYRQTSIEDIISHYEVEVNTTLGTQKDRYKTDEIILKNDVSISNPIFGESKLLPLNKVISNMKGAYDTRNILIYKRGAIGILTPQQDKEGMSNLPDKEQIEAIQEEYQNTYGALNNGNIIAIGTVPMDWTPMVMPIKELMLFEEIDEDFNRIIDAYGLNRHIFSSTKGSTFNNVKQGILQGYQDTIIPLIDDWLNSLNEDWGLKDEGLTLTADWSHVPVLQEDLERDSKILLNKTKAYQTLVNSGFKNPDDVINF